MKRSRRWLLSMLFVCLLITYSMQAMADTISIEDIEDSDILPLDDIQMDVEGFDDILFVDDTLQQNMPLTIEDLIIEQPAEDIQAKSSTDSNANGIPNDALYWNGHYYNLYDLDDVKGWTAAEAFCENLGGYLATITSAKEDAFIYNEVLCANGYKDAYFGLTDKDDEGKWRWITGEKLSYLNWADGEPNGGTSENYGMYYYQFGDGRWNDANFSGRSAFVCEWGDYEPEEEAMFVTTYKGHRYELFDIDSIDTWQKAKSYCEKQGGYLAIITSAEENDFIYRNIVRGFGYTSAYFGLTDEGHEGVWKWVNGKKAAFTNWADGEPNNEGSDENYAMFYWKFTDGRWNDGDFYGNTQSGGKAFICEWDQEKTVVPKKVTLNRSEVRLKVGKTVTLKATVSPAKASGKLMWKSSNSKVASVNSKGVVTAKKAGNATISVKTYNGKTAKCKVIVSYVMPTGISLNKKTATMHRNKTLTLKPSFTPKDTTDTTVTWKSSDPLVATVDSKGVVTALRPGKATITAVSKADKSLKATCTVTVAGKFRALMIGQNKYKKNPLEGCVNDANAMKGMLDGLADNYVTCKVQKNRTANEIVSDIETYLSSATEDDVSVFFYSGHGANANGGTNQGALCGVDGSRLSTAKLASALGKVKGRVIVLIDACHSGALISKNGGGSASAPFNPNAFVQDFMSAFADRGDVSNAAEFRNSKYVVLVAAGFDETSSEEPTGMLWWKSHQGRFTAALIKGMGCNYKKGTYKGSMPADKNSDKGVTVKELYNYIKNEVGEEQTTGYYADNTGEIMFMR